MFDTLAFLYVSSIRTYERYILAKQLAKIYHVQRTKKKAAKQQIPSK